MQSRAHGAVGLRTYPVPQPRGAVPLPTEPTVASAAANAELTKRLLDTLELWAKIAGAVLGLGVFVKRVLKPYTEWRRKALATMMRDILKEELARLDAVSEREDEVFRLLGRVLARQDEFFNDIDAFIGISTHNTERIDEINELLDVAGFASDRRSGVDRRVIDQAMSDLLTRRRQRRRLQTDDIRADTLNDLAAIRHAETRHADTPHPPADRADPAGDSDGGFL